MKLIARLLVFLCATVWPASVALAQQTPPDRAPGPYLEYGVKPPGDLGTPRSEGLVGSDLLVGSVLRDSQGRDVGTISQLMIDRSNGRVRSVLITPTSKASEPTLLLPWNALKIGQDQQGKVVVSVKKPYDVASNAEQRAKQRGPRE